MPLPPRQWFRIEEIAKRWGLQPPEIEAYALDETLELSVFVASVRAEEGTWETVDERSDSALCEQGMILDGPQPLLRSSLLEIFRNGQAEVRNFRSPQARGFLRLLPDMPSLVVRREDTIVTRRERDRFESEHGLTPVSGEGSQAEFWHNDEFTRVRVASRWMSFGPKQAAVLRLLKEAGESDNPWRDGKLLLDGADAATMRLIDLFKRKPEWRELVIADGKGRYRLITALLSPERRRIRLFRKGAYDTHPATLTAFGG